MAIVTQTPETFKGGTIWQVILNIHGALQAIGLALLVLFFVVGVMKTCGSFAEVKKPEHALKLFIRFAIAKIVVTYGLDLMLSLFKIVSRCNFNYNYCFWFRRNYKHNIATNNNNSS